MSTFVIVGASVAGGLAAETLRKEGFDGRVVLVGAEPVRPYERPPLSKEYQWGTRSEESVFLKPPGFYEEQGIELLTGRDAVSLDTRSRRVSLADGSRIGYDRLLIATGASPRRLAVPGADLEGVLYLRTLEDARALRERISGSSRVVVVGAGFIGAEVAASCRRAGLEVVMLEVLPVPLQRALGPRVGQVYADMHRAHGVDLRTGEGVAELRGHGRVERVVTTSGHVFDCDFVVVGIGVAPETRWLEGSGVEVHNGVVVDELCRASAPDVYAAGDVASWWHPGFGERLRVEHFDNAQSQGVAAARSMLDKEIPYAPVPFFWSDQYEVSLQYVGHASGEDPVVFRGDPGSGSWSAFYLRDGWLRAALGVNRFRDVSAARRLIAAHVSVEPEKLADEGFDLKTLAREVARSR